MYFIISILVIVLTLVVFGTMLGFYCCDPAHKETLPFLVKIKLFLMGVISFISDTVGIGSFAIMIALGKLWKITNDKHLPGFLNGVQVLPGAIESIVFLKVIQADALTLVVLVVGACIGGVIGGLTVSKLNQKHLQLTMAISFIAMALLILLNQLHWLPIGGVATQLRGVYLWLGFFGMVICGFVPALGVGLFAVVQVLLFLLGLSPLIAFPIMTTAGALQQPLTTFTFTLNRAIPLEKVFIVSTAGVIGVLLTVPFITHLPLNVLRWLLFLIVSYNAIMMFRSYYRARRQAPDVFIPDLRGNEPIF